VNKTKHIESFRAAYGRPLSHPRAALASQALRFGNIFHVNTLFTYAALCGELRQCYNKTSKKPLPKEEKT